MKAFGSFYEPKVSLHCVIESKIPFCHTIIHPAPINSLQSFYVKQFLTYLYKQVSIAPPPPHSPS